MTTKYKIRECADGWTLDIPFPDEVVSLFFHSKNNAELAKAILECEDAHPNKAVPFQSTHIGEPLTLEQLREMDGKPVWIDTGNQYSDWGKVDFKRFRVWPFGQEDSWWDFGHYGEWKPYAYPPSHIDQEAWEPCEVCNGEKILYQHTNTTKLFMNTFGEAATLVTECMACPPHANCCMREIPSNSAFKINFCPECGRPLTEEAWAMLEKKLNGGG